MDHRQVEELIDAHALGALDEPERSQVEAHLAECGDCRVQFEEASMLTQQLALSVPVQRAPRDLFHRTMADIHRDIAESQPQDKKVSWIGAWLPRLAPASAAAAAVVAIAALGLTINLDNRVDDIDDADGNVQQQQLVNLALAADDRQQAELGAQDVSVVPEPTEEQVTALYIWTPKHAAGWLIVAGLAAGKTYLACYETERSGVRDGGQMVASSMGQAQTAFPILRDDPLVAVGFTAGGSCQESDWLRHWELENPESCLPVRLTDGLVA
jgi:hypothetical protein